MESHSERIVKIGVYLPKLWPKNKVAVFFLEHRVDKNDQGSGDVQILHICGCKSVCKKQLMNRTYWTLSAELQLGSDMVSGATVILCHLFMFRYDYQIIQVVLISCLAVLIRRCLPAQLRVMDVVPSCIVVIRESRDTCRHRYFLPLSRRSWKTFSANAATCWRNSIWRLTLLLSQWSFRPLPTRLRRRGLHCFWSCWIWWIYHIASTVDFLVSLCSISCSLGYCVPTCSSEVVWGGEKSSSQFHTRLQALHIS